MVLNPINKCIPKYHCIREELSGLFQNLIAPIYNVQFILISISITISNNIKRGKSIFHQNPDFAHMCKRPKQRKFLYGEL